MIYKIPFTERKTPWRGVFDLSSGCYPSFLFYGQHVRGLPVFHFHDVSAEYLEPYLAYLAANGYQTVTSRALAAYLRGESLPRQKPVILCFDDAWRSLYDVVAPLLRRYGLTAITYAIPQRIDAEATASGPRRFCSWVELQELERSGTIDVQPHSYSHAMIFCSSDPVGFVTPEYKEPLLSRPWLNIAPRFLDPADLGYPLYPCRSRLSDAPRYSENPAAAEACMALVRNQGGPAFFERPNWQDELQAVMDEYLGSYETEEEQHVAISDELVKGREILAARLSKDLSLVDHICFPWAIAGKIAESALANAGYKTAFADKLFGRRIVRPGQNRYRLMRLRHEYIFCLPGKKQRPLWSAKKRPPLPGISPRVCLLISSFYPAVGGGETHALLLSRALVDIGVPVLVLTRQLQSNSPTTETVNGANIIRVWGGKKPRLGKYFMLVPALLALVKNRGDYDVIYVCGLRVLGLVGVLASTLLGKKCVLRSEACGELSGDFIWSSPHSDQCRAKHGGFAKALISLLIRLRNCLYAKADVFLSISQVITDEYRHAGVPENKLVCITNGIDTERYVPVSAERKKELREKLSLPADKIIFAYSGKLNKGKGLEFLLAVWRRLLAAQPLPVHLLLVGSGGGQFLSCEAELRAFVEQHGLAATVTFTGYVERVEEYLQSADCFVFPSRSESLGLALVEALACGLPSFSSRIGGIADIVTDGVNGWLLPAEDEESWCRALAEAAATAEGWSAVREKARASVLAKFSIGAIAKQHKDLFWRLKNEQ